MEARQRVKLSLTNSSFGLITLISPCSSLKAPLALLKRSVVCAHARSYLPVLRSAGAPNNWRRAVALAKLRFVECPKRP